LTLKLTPMVSGNLREVTRGHVVLMKTGVEITSTPVGRFANRPEDQASAPPMLTPRCTVLALTMLPEVTVPLEPKRRIL